LRASGPPTGQISPDQARSIQQWTRTYAQNRTLGLVVNLCIFVLLSGMIGGSSLLTAYAFVKGSTVLLILGLLACIFSLVALVWFSVPRLGGRWQERLAARLYAKEGQVSVQSGAKSPSKVDIAVGIAFGACIIASVEIGFWIDIPLKYMQPISATYCVPFLLYLSWRTRPASSRLMLLWPTLYALHALLVVCGVPIVWSPPWDALNMLIPVAGYGILAGLTGHLYSRLALRRLRTLAGPSGESGSTTQEIGSHD
jgi:hypothetical protein